MKINLKKKVMLAVLAGGMLCANGAFATDPYLYYNSSGAWQTADALTSITNACTTGVGANLDSSDVGYTNQIITAYNASGSVNENVLTIDSGGVFSDNNLGIYGGYASGAAINNKINIRSGIFANPTDPGSGGTYTTTPTVNIYAGYGYNGVSGNISGNTININGGDFRLRYKSCIAAGMLELNSTDPKAGDVTGNKIFIDSGTFNFILQNGNTPEIVAGYVKGSGDENASKVSNNVIEIKGGTFISSGENDRGSIIAGKKDLRDGDSKKTSNPSCYVGGTSKENGNRVIVDGATFKGSAASVSNYNFLFAGGVANADKAVAQYNSVVIKNVNVVDNVKMTVWGGKVESHSTPSGVTTGNGNASYNYVEIHSGRYDEICGGYANGHDSVANNNEVHIYAGTIIDGNVDAGNAGSKDNSVANDNKLYIHGGEFGDGVKITVGSAQSMTGSSAEGNELFIEDGDFSGNNIFWGGAGMSAANNNKVYISGGTFGEGCRFLGGYSPYGSSSGNLLDLQTRIGGKAQMVMGFQEMKFVLPDNTGAAMLKTQSITYDNTTISVEVASGVTLNGGSTITLIEADTKTGDVSNLGPVLDGAGEISINGNNLILTMLQSYTGVGGNITGGSEDEQKAPVEGVAAAAVIVNASADLASGEGMKSLVAETAGGFTNTFGAFTAGSSKYKTGSHVDVDGWGVLVGAGTTKNWQDGSATTYGLFFEYGKGDFDTYNGDVHGDGDSENKGVGIMVRHKLTNNTYYEGNIRYGKQETEWSESDIGSYDTDSRYYGISVGMGHIFPAGKNEFDVYGRYSYGHVGACDATVKTSEYHFDSVKSHRVRLGAKYNFVQENNNAKPYIGLAWEHEFKGESKASISGVGEAPAPSMKGNTGIFEVGCDWNVSKKWTLGLGANAYIGKRKGWDGMARVFYNF